MKKLKLVFSIVSFIAFIWAVHGCKNVTPPTAPSSNNTPVVYTQTKTATSGATATFTATVSATSTNTTVSTAVLTVTDTAQYTQTASCTFSVTQTQTFTGTISPTATVTLTTIMNTFTSTMTTTGTFTPTISITPTVTLTATATIPSINSPFGVVYANSNLYVSMPFSNGLVMKFSTGGTYISTVGSIGTGNGQYTNPTGLATDSSGNIYVTDQNNGRIVEFNSSGGFVRNFGSYGFGSGQLNLPSGVAVDSTGNVFVADFNNSNIVEFNSSGGFVRSFGSAFFQGICVDTSNNVYATSTAYKVYEYSNTGTLIGSFGTQGTGPGQFLSLVGITTDSSGNIFVMDQTNGMEEFGTSPSFTYNSTYAGSYNYPQDITWNNGIIYVANMYNNDILQIIPTTPTATATATCTETVTPVVTVCTMAFGNNDVNYTGSLWGGYLIGSPFVAGTSSTVNSIGGQHAGDSVIAGIYSDSSGKPETLLAQTVVTVIAGEPFEIPLISSLPLTQGTTYWLIIEGINYGAVPDNGVPGTTLYASEPWANVSSGLPADISSLSWSSPGSTSVELAAYNCQ